MTEFGTVNHRQDIVDIFWMLLLLDIFKTFDLGSNPLEGDEALLVFKAQ